MSYCSTVVFRKGRGTVRKSSTPKQIIRKLRASEVHLVAGMPQAQAANREKISVHSYPRWRKEYDGLKADQAKRLKDMEKKNARLKKLMAELSLDKAMLKEVGPGKLLSLREEACGG
ncbi:MAG: transposase [Planctomycetota bacterium]